MPFGVRPPLDDLEDAPGRGVSLWLAVPDLDQVVGAAGDALARPPFDTPFGRAAILRDPAGYAVTVHEG